MLSDLSEVMRNVDKPLTEVRLDILLISCNCSDYVFVDIQAQIKSYLLMLMKGVAHCHQNSIMHRVCCCCVVVVVVVLSICFNYCLGFETSKLVDKFIWSFETG